MHKRKRHTALSALLSIVFAFACAGAALGQQAAGASNTQTVNAQQSGAWPHDIDPTRNTAQLPNTAADPLPVKVVASGPGRKPFQTRVIVNVPAGSTTASGQMAIPAGKRLVIENVSAVARTTEGLRMEIQYDSYFDNGDGVGDISDITFHRMALTDQGTFPSMVVATANHKVLVFADEQIGASRYGVTVQVRLTGPATGIAQGQVTFSGYLEDLPTAQ